MTIVGKPVLCARQEGQHFPPRINHTDLHCAFFVVHACFSCPSYVEVRKHCERQKQSWLGPEHVVGKHINGLFRGGGMICVGTSAEFMSLPYEFAATHRNMSGSPKKKHRAL